MSNVLAREGIARGPIDEQAVVADITARMSARLASRSLDLLINDCCFTEIKRLKAAKTSPDDPYLVLLKDARSRLAYARREELDAILRAVPAERQRAMREAMRAVWTRFTYAGSLVDDGFLPASRPGLSRGFLREHPVPALKKVVSKAVGGDGV